MQAIHFVRKTRAYTHTHTQIHVKACTYTHTRSLRGTRGHRQERREEIYIRKSRFQESGDLIMSFRGNVKSRRKGKHKRKCFIMAKKVRNDRSSFLRRKIVTAFVTIKGNILVIVKRTVVNLRSFHVNNARLSLHEPLHTDDTQYI